MNERIEKALDIIKNFGGYEDHHKQWVLDQVVRTLADDYDKWVLDYCKGEDGPCTYSWDTGIGP